MLKTSKVVIFSAVLIGWGCLTDSAARDLIASVGIIPPHSEVGADGHPRGGFVEVVKAIDRVYTEGNISIKLFPLARSIMNLKTGQADFHIPYIPNPHVPPETLPFAYASEPIVNVAFVLYTRSDKSILPMERLEDYKIETLRGAAPHFAFDISEIDSFRQGLLRVTMGRTDGFIVEQDGTDNCIRKNKIKNIRRTLYATWNSSILVPKGPEGKEIDRIISGALRKLKEKGELQKITDTIHRPFSDWQPYQIY